METKLPKWARRYLTLLGALAVLGIAAACVWFAQAALENAQRPQPRYLLKDTGGYVSLYTADGRGPLAQYDLLTRLLPEQDVLALQQGVPVQDEAELQQRLEDYGLLSLAAGRVLWYDAGVNLMDKGATHHDRASDPGRRAGDLPR